MLDRGNFPEEMWEPSSGETEASVKNVVCEIKMWSARLPSVTVATTDNQTFHIGLWQLWLIMAFLIVLKSFVYFTRQESSTRMEHLRAQCSDGWELRPSRTGPRLLTVTHPCTRSPADRIVLIILTICYFVIIFFLLALQIWEELSLWSSLTNNI